MPMIPPASVRQRGLAQFTRVPYGWDTGYKAAQAALRANGTPIRVWLHGHSIMNGEGATDKSTDGFAWLVRNFLVNKFGQSADYFPVTKSAQAGDFSGGAGTWPGGTPPWVINTAPYGYMIGTIRLGPLGFADLSYGGMGGDATWINPGNGTDIATFTTQSWLGNCRAFDIVFPNITAGTPMRWSVDGGAATNLTIGSTGRIEVHQPAGLAGLSDAQHVVLIEGVGASGQPWLSGVTAHKTTRGAAGVQVAHLAANSATFWDYDNNYLTKALLGLDSSTGTVGLGEFPMCPDLVICNWFGLAATPDISPQMILMRLAHYIESLRRANPNCSFIFVSDHTPNGVTTDSTFPLDLYTLSAPNLLAAASQLTDAYNCAWVNVHGAWQGRALANGYVSAGDVHPTTVGHANIAPMITGLL